MTWPIPSSLQRLTLLYSLLITIYLPACSAYRLAREYRGLTFFDAWDFFPGPDVFTHGNVNFLDQGNAFHSQLAYVNEHYNAILKVDNGYVPMGGQRNSLRMATQDPFYVGTLLIADFVHLPFGCSVWPAFWSTGPTWPDNGEIDIIEQINMANNNQMALHSLPGCFQSNPVWQTGISGGQYQTGEDCSTAAGCVVEDTSSASFGPNFAIQGGGVWAAQFDVQGVFIWFWSRPSIPPALTAAVAGTGPIEMSTWGPPSAAYMATGCNITEFFAPQKLILDITLCGDWAGEPTNYARTCGGQGPTGKCYEDNVPGDGANYDNAYFEISYIRTYTTGGAGPLPTPAVAGAVWNSLTATAASTTVTSFGTLHAQPTGSGASAARSSMMTSLAIFASVLGGVTIGALFMGL